MLMTVGILIFFFAILASIALHELGHMIPAKKFGVKVTEYMVGFGPTLWSKKKGETEYGVKAIPLGGYVRLIGMLPPGKDSKGDAVGCVKGAVDVETANAGEPMSTKADASTGSEEVLEEKPKYKGIKGIVENARAASEADILTPEDRRRAFYQLSARKKIVVMMSGPLVNLAIALVLFTIMFAGFGMPEATLKIDRLTGCVPTATNPTGECNSSESIPAPAKAAGILIGDKLVSLNDQKMESWEQFKNYIDTLPPGEATVVVSRNGVEKTLPVTLANIPGPNGKELAFLGIGPVFELVPDPITQVPSRMWTVTTQSVQGLISFPGKLVGVGKAAFSDAPRDPTGPVGMVGVGRISGEVTSSDIPVSWKIAQLIGIIASVNFFLFLFNMLPLLPLDGGHVAGALWEGMRNVWAKFRGLPKPAPVDVAQLLPVAYILAAVFIGLSVLLVYADFVKPIRLG